VRADLRAFFDDRNGAFRFALLEPDRAPTTITSYSMISRSLIGFNPQSA